ncbi:MAG: hypothetical protein HSCHL_2161 [Hydrogenibacillus schlegelii]|uniref:Uncharacterized protein n=1 Tax=Hydrogenibacillus schlegelii TaxID=1484 RepID=A0A2T5G9V1_HYDSH|nr:MAG: hypothetical protein HSCHL_2161 [Hydrogenibacillus schlegelii]
MNRSGKRRLHHHLSPFRPPVTVSAFRRRRCPPEGALPAAGRLL